MCCPCSEKARGHFRRRSGPEDERIEMISGGYVEESLSEPDGGA